MPPGWQAASAASLPPPPAACRNSPVPGSAAGTAVGTTFRSGHCLQLVQEAIHRAGPPGVVLHRLADDATDQRLRELAELAAQLPDDLVAVVRQHLIPTLADSDA